MVVKCPICGADANDIDRGLFDGDGFDCKSHGPFRVTRTVLTEDKKRTQQQWEKALETAQRRATSGKLPLIHSDYF
jgi:hypothetical protein